MINLNNVFKGTSTPTKKKQQQQLKPQAMMFTQKMRFQQEKEKETTNEIVFIFTCQFYVKVKLGLLIISLNFFGSLFYKSFI